jgi:hypothetical protein
LTDEILKELEAVKDSNSEMIEDQTSIDLVETSYDRSIRTMSLLTQKKTETPVKE